MKIKFSKGLVEDARKIREEVFVQEQGFKNEFDEIDKSATHVVVYKDTIPVATGRTFIENNHYIIGRVAVTKAYRGQDIGKQVITSLEEKIKELGGVNIQLSAQTQASGFYEKLGYYKKGKEYLDEHCPHVTMIKEL